MDLEYPMSFTGFDPQAVALLSRLPKMHEKAYGAQKALLNTGLREPGFLLLQDLVAAGELPLQLDKRSSVSPLHRDLRFAKAGSPRYKDHLLLTAWEGTDKKTSPTMWLRIDSESVGFASGLVFTPAQRTRYREVVAGPEGAELASAIAVLKKSHGKHGFEVSGEALKRVPAPYDSEHERAELLKLNGIQVRFSEPTPKSIAGASFSAWCLKRWQALLPVHHFLAQEMIGRDAS